MNKSTFTEEKVLGFCLDYLGRWNRGYNPELPVEADSVRRICTNLLNSYFRYRGFIKLLISEFTGDRKVDNKVQNLLELTVTQLIFQRGVTQYTAVNVSVEVAKRRIRKASGFVNGVLRNFVRKYEKSFGDKPVQKLREIYGEKYNEIFLGTKLFMHWRSRFSKEELDALIKVLEKEVKITVRKKAGVTHIPDFLEPIDVKVPDCDMYICYNATELFNYYMDDFYVQDAATLLAASLVEVDGENRVIGDFCAAPGGKSSFIADRLHQSSILYSCDVNESRLPNLKENLQSYDNVEVQYNDATNPRFEDKMFDSVILDVPCSNSGVIRKRPDVKWRFSQKKVKDLVLLQEDIFVATLPLIKDGGSIVYSTCSIEPEENRRQVEFFLEEFPFCTLEKEIVQMPTMESDGSYAALIRIDRRK